MEKFTVISCPLTDALVSALHPDIMDADLSAEFLQHIMGMREVNEGENEILLAPLSQDNHLYQLWLAATYLKLYAKKFGRYDLPSAVIDGVKRAWEGVWEVFWGTMSVKFPRHERMTLARIGTEPCIIVTPEARKKPSVRVSVIAVGGGPEEQAMAKHMEEALNAEMGQED